MKWSKWIKIADHRYSYVDELEYEGPSVYELGIWTSSYLNVMPVYVGETVNERKRICSYADYGSHMSEIIHWHLKRGWILFYRGIALPSKQRAKQIQDSLLYKFDYDWNIVRNPKY